MTAPTKLGRQSYHNSVPRDWNPHPKGSREYKLWDAGWMKEDRANRL